MLFKYEEYFNSQKRRFYLLYKDDRRAIAKRFLEEENAKIQELYGAGHLTAKQANDSRKYLELMMNKFIATGDIED